MKTLPSLILLAFALSSCNSTFVAKSKSGSSLAYTGSFASKATLDKTHMELADGTVIDKEIHNKDEVEAVHVLGNTQLYKAGINAGVSTTNAGIKALKK